MDHFEMMLYGVHLNVQLVDCWNGFYARIVLTYHHVLAGFSLPYAHLWAPLPHLGQLHFPGDLSQHVVFIPGGTSFIFSYEFRAMGIAARWQEWLPLVVHYSVLMIWPVAFVLRKVYDSAVCPIGTSIFALIPALTPGDFPTVIAAKVTFPPLVAMGAVFCPDCMNRIGVLRHLGLEGMCHPEDEEPCQCYHNGIEMTDDPSMFSSADFVSCNKGRSYTMIAEDVVSVVDTDSVIESVVSIQNNSVEQTELINCECPNEPAVMQSGSSRA